MAGRTTAALVALRDVNFNNLEDNVNGSWNTTLSTFFPFAANPVPPVWDNTWVIYPEALAPFTSQGRKTDLLVGQLFQVTPNVPEVHVRLVYEGKRRGGDSFTQIAVQLRNWMIDCHFTQYNQPRTWMMGAKGSQAAFWVWDASQTLDNRLRGVSGWNAATGRPNFGNQGTTNIRTFDISNQFEFLDIDLILAYMANNPIPQYP